MAVLSDNRPAGQQWAEVGQRVLSALAWLLFAAGWLTAKALRALATGIGAALFACGWLAAAVAWPALCWCGRAVSLGWEEGRKPIGGRRGSA
jgi:protein-S-isoprenylcysteine O-methyltransferase Ste14